MATRYEARPTQLRLNNVVAPAQGDTEGLRRMGSALMERGAQEQITIAEDQGYKDQAANPNDLQQRDVGWFNSRTNEAYNAAARQKFSIDKRQQIDETLFNLAQTNERNPNAFREASLDAKKEILGNVHSKDLPVMESLYNQMETRYAQGLQKDLINFQRDEQLISITGEYDRILTDISLEVEQSGELSDETETRFQAFLDASFASGVSPATIASWQEAAQKAELTGVAFNGYREATNKAEYMDSLLDDNGPLSDLNIDDRKYAHRQVQVLASEDAQRRGAAVSSMRSLITEALGLERKGVAHQNSAQLLIQASQFPELQSEAIELGAYMTNRDELRARSTASVQELDQVIETERRRDIDRGGTNTPDQTLLDATISLRDDLAQAQTNGTELEFYLDHGLIGLQTADSQTGLLPDPRKRQDTVEGLRSVGKNPRFYLQDEITQFKNLWNVGTVAERQQLIDTIRTQTPASDIGNLTRELGEESGVFGLVLRLQSLGGDGAYMGRRILRGDEYAKNMKGTIDFEERYTKEIGELLMTLDPYDVTGHSNAQMSKAILALAVDNLRAGGINSRRFEEISKGDLEDATAQIYGYKSMKDFPKVEGKFVLPPYRSYDKGQFEDVWSGISDEFLEATGQGVRPVDQFGNSVSADQIYNDGFPVLAGPGIYHIAVPRADDQDEFLILTNSVDGSPFELRWSDLENSLPKELPDMSPNSGTNLE